MKCKQCGKVLDHKYFTPICQDCYNSSPSNGLGEKPEIKNKQIAESGDESSSQGDVGVLLKFIFFPTIIGCLIMQFNGWETIPSWLGSLPEYLMIGSILVVIVLAIIFSVVGKIFGSNPKKRVHKKYPILGYFLCLTVIILPFVIELALFVDVLGPGSKVEALPAEITQYYRPSRIPAGYGMKIIKPDGSFDEFYVNATSVNKYRLKKGDKGKVLVQTGLLGIDFIESYDFDPEGISTSH